MIICYIRILNVFSVNIYLGPLLIMIGRMIKDITLWLFLWFIFFISFTVSFYAMTTEAQNFWLSELQTDGYFTSNDLAQSVYPIGSLLSAYWGFLGNFGFVMPIYNASYLGAILLAIYLLLVNVMLVNLLIAMMAYTFMRIRANSNEEWKYNRYELIQQNTFANITPPPLNLILYFVEIIKYLVSCGCTKPKVENPEGGHGVYRKSTKDKDHILGLLAFYKSIFLENEEKKVKESVLNKVGITRTAIDQYHLGRTDDKEYVDIRFKAIEDSLQKIATILNVQLEKK